VGSHENTLKKEGNGSFRCNIFVTYVTGA